MTTASAFTTFADVEAFTAKLMVIADSRDELQCKLDRAALRFELCGLDPEEQEQLTEEVSAFVSLITGRRPSRRRRANPSAKQGALHREERPSVRPGRS